MSHTVKNEARLVELCDAWVETQRRLANLDIVGELAYCQPAAEPTDA